MPTRLPPVKRLAHEIRTVERRGQTIGDSLDYLCRKRSEIAVYGDPESLGVAAYEGDSDANAFAVNFDLARNAIIEHLWRREIFISSSVMDQLLFDAIVLTTGDPLVTTLGFLRDRRATRPGLIVFPLHSLSILGAGLLRGDTKERSQFVHEGWGTALTPQTNAIDQTIGFLNRACNGLGLHKLADPEAIRHWRRSRAKWLDQNPLVAIRMTTQRGSYYDTERLVLARVRAATAQLAMVSVFQRDTDRSVALFGSGSINNWETLDIRHYIVFSDNPGRRDALDGDCVPIRGRDANVLELSDLSISLDPRYRGSRRRSSAIATAVQATYRGHLHYMWPNQRNARTRTLARLFESLSFFLRSFHTSRHSWASTVSLSTAFEMILTDHYSPGVTQRIQRRLRLVLRGVRGTRSYQESVASLYAARGNLVHAGTDPSAVDLSSAQQAFVHVFTIIAPRVASLPDRTDRPMAILTGDT